MSRGLRPAFFALFLAAAVTASAGPDDLFDARPADAFQPGQKEYLLALEGGRYSLRDGRVLDSKAAAPLTNAKVAALLSAARAVGRGAEGGDGAVQDGAQDLRTADLSNPKPAQTNFDGGIARTGGVIGPQANPGGQPGRDPAAAPADPALLQAQLLRRLVFTGTPAEKAALAESVETILKSPTGRQLAALFVAERAGAEIKIATIEHAKAVADAGKKTVTGTAGMTDTEKVPPVVTISRAYLDTDPEYRRLAMAGTLAHELFGHAFEDQRARKAGLPHEAHYYYRGDEAGSRLIDWLIQTELAGKTVEGDPSRYLEDAEGYYKELITTDPYYAITLSLAEMKNPSTTLKSRRAMVDAATAESAAGIKSMKEWRPIIEHFVTVHKKPRASLKPAEEELTAYFAWADIHAAKLVEIKKTIEERIKYWETPAGAKVKKQIIAAADSDYLKKYETTLAVRARALRRLRAGPAGGARAPSSEGPVMMMPGLVITPSGAHESLNLDALGVLYREDLKKNPRHWNK